MALMIGMPRAELLLVWLKLRKKLRKCHSFLDLEGLSRLSLRSESIFPMNSPKEPESEPGGRALAMGLRYAVEWSVVGEAPFGEMALPEMLRRDARGMRAEGFIGG